MTHRKVRIVNNTIKATLMMLLISFCLSLTGYSQDVDTLIRRLKDENSDVRREAATALGNTKDTRAVEPLIAALKDPPVRFKAAWALGNIGAPAVEPLIAALKDKDSSVRREATSALVKIGTPAVEPLIAALKDKDSSVRKEAAMALGNLKDTSAVEPLIAALKDEDLDIVARAYPFFIKRGEPGIEPILIKALNKRGDPTMAVDFLNSGNSQLEEAARKWLSARGYTIFPSFSGRSGPSWGSGR